MIERDGSEFQEYENVTVEYRDASHRYWLHANGERVPAVSVTSALKVLDKPALLSWAEKAGIEGALTLERQGELAQFEPHNTDEIAPLLALHGLGKDAKRDAGADRGTLVHEALELWAREQRVPDLSEFPAELHGYVQGLAAFLVAVHPKPSSVERFVGSIAHRYAGRLDMRGLIGGRDCIVDLKTNPKGRVYDEAHLQSRAYAIADVECGNPYPDAIVIVAVGEEGNFEMVDCQAETGDWLNVLAAHRSMTRLRNVRAASDRATKAALAA